MSTNVMRMLLACAVAAALTACEQGRNNDATGAAVRDVPRAAVSSATTAEPAKVPANDPSLPPYGTAPATGASAVAGAPGAGAVSSTDASHSTLTPGERDRALPLEGQVNNYSSDAFAKRGDSNVEHTQEGPRGSEAVATPNSYPKEPK